MYPIKRASRSEFIPVRNLSYHVRVWGDARAGAPPLVMVHGWMDVAASYQFVVDAMTDAFARGRQIIAPTGAAMVSPPCPAPTTTGFPTTWPTSTPCWTTMRPTSRWIWSVTAWAATW